LEWNENSSKACVWYCDRYNLQYAFSLEVVVLLAFVWLLHISRGMYAAK
jgi:hypothetical protein